MLKNQRGITVVRVAVTIAAVVVVLAAGILLYTRLKNKGLEFNTPYQAVLLINGSVYFGKLEGFGTKFPVLRDVYYVQSTTNPETKQTTSVLVKRGRELHGPDRMYLNPSQIILVEPVGPNSKVAQLIHENQGKSQ
jgi:hypothetical protein